MFIVIFYSLVVNSSKTAVKFDNRLGFYTVIPMTTRIKDTFASAYKTIAADFSSETTNDHLANIKMAPLTAPVRGGDQCKAKNRVPAYYNPNNHTIYFNRAILNTLSETTIYNICYHELLHAISCHQSYDTTTATVFQSGIKMEFYSGGPYRCVNRGLNEGIVQYLTNVHTHTYEHAYKNEVYLVAQAISFIGLDPFLTAFFEGEVSVLESSFDEVFGQGAFTDFARAIDNKDYDKAEATLVQFIPAFSSVPAFATAAI